MKINNYSDFSRFIINQAFKTESSYSFKEKCKSLAYNILSAFGSTWAERKLSLLQTAHRITPFYSRNTNDKAGWLLNEGRPVLNYVLNDYAKRNPIPIPLSANDAATCLANTENIWNTEKGKFWQTGGFDFQLAVDTLIEKFPMP